MRLSSPRRSSWSIKSRKSAYFIEVGPKALILSGGGDTRRGIDATVGRGRRIIGPRRWTDAKCCGYAPCRGPFWARSAQGIHLLRIVATTLSACLGVLALIGAT